MTSEQQNSGLKATEPAVDSAPCLTVFHDGSCPMCRREIALARKLTEPGSVAFVDVDAIHGAVAPGLTAEAAMRRFHVLRSDGALLSGAPAFIELWSRAPRLKWLAKVAGWPHVVGSLDRLYSGFLFVRPALSRFLRRFER